MKLLSDEHKFKICVRAGLSHTERFLATGCLLRLLRNGNKVPTVDLEYIPNQEIKQNYQKEIYLVRLGYYLLTWQILSKLSQQKFWPICYEELAALAEQYPETLSTFRPIVSIFEAKKNVGAFGYTSFSLSEHVGQKIFCSIASGDGFGENVWFAVCKI